LFFSGLATKFLKEFVFDLWIVAPMLLSLAAAVTLLGQIVGKKEGWTRFDSFYWSFITATTVGYGDLHPIKKGSKIISVVIALVGFTLTGIFVAVAVHSATIALSAHDAATRVR
jgi:hypothetical protein